MKTSLKHKNITEIDADVTVELLTKDAIETHDYAEILKQAGFKADEDQICFLHEKKVLVCALTCKDNDSVRMSMTNAIKALKTSNYTSAKVEMIDDGISGMVEGVILGGYDFNAYKSKPTEITIKEIVFATQSADFKALEKTFKEAKIVAKATCFTRDIVNMAPQELNPPELAKLAKKLAKENDLECEILNEDALAKENMNAMLAVGRASVHQSQLIHLSYKPKNPKKIITLVGKGLTYDSGGLSLKAATSMVTMKMDKAGACAVLGMLKAASELKLDIEIHGFIGAVENMVGGDAYKPDDVLVSRSGTTIEVRNTDAEGRLVLADVLSYAQDKIKSDYIFDFATLTGACMVALGTYTTGVMGHSDALKQSVTEAAKRSGELTGILPFNRHLPKLLKSDIADISNTASKPYGGAITAGLFLDKFILDENKEKWLHFDIAGSAYTESAWDCNVYGGTGAGVRMISDFLKNVE